MYNYNINHTANKKMIKRYITLIYCSVTLWGLFTIPDCITVPVSHRASSIFRSSKAFIRSSRVIVCSCALTSKGTVMQTGKEVPLEIEKLELPPLSVFSDTVT